MDYFTLGTQYAANMTQPQRKAAYLSATGTNSSIGKAVSIKVKDSGGADVTLTMDQDQFVAFNAGFAPL